MTYLGCAKLWQRTARQTAGLRGHMWNEESLPDLLVRANIGVGRLLWKIASYGSSLMWEDADATYTRNW